MERLLKFMFLSVFLFASVTTNSVPVLAKNEMGKRKQLPSISAISTLTPEDKKTFFDKNDPRVQNELWEKVSEGAYFFLRGDELQYEFEKKRNN